MNAARGILLANMALSFYSVGAVWVVQVLCYPLWAYVGRAEFFAYHIAWWHRLPGVIFVPAGLVLVGSIAMLWIRPPGIPVRAVWLGIVLQGVTYFLTAVYWAPLQMRLATEAHGLSAPEFHRLMTTHWLRVALITAYGVLMFWMVAQSAWPGTPDEAKPLAP